MDVQRKFPYVFRGWQQAYLECTERIGGGLLHINRQFYDIYGNFYEVVNVMDDLNVFCQCIYSEYNV